LRAEWLGSRRFGGGDVRLEFDRVHAGGRRRVDVGVSRAQAAVVRLADFGADERGMPVADLARSNGK